MSASKRLPLLRLVASMSAGLLLAACASNGPEVTGIYVVDGQPVEQDVADYYGRGLENLEMGRYGLALDDLRRALRVAADPVPVLNAIGVSYGQLGRYDVANGYYLRALALEPSSVQTLNNLARAMMAQGRPELALEYLMRIEGEGQAEPVVLANLDAAAAALAAAHAAGLQSGGHGQGQALEPGGGLPTAWVVRATALVQTLLTSGLASPIAQGFAQETAGIDQAAWRAAAFVLPETTAVSAAFLPGIVGLGTGAVAAEEDLPGAAGVLPGVPWISAPPVTTITVEPLPPAQTAAPAMGAVAETPRTVEPVTAGAFPAGLLVEVANGTGRERMAARMGRWLGSRGLDDLVLTNDPSFVHGSSVLFYRPDMREAALRLAETLPMAVALEPTAGLYADLRLLLGADLLAFDKTLLIAEEEAI